MDDMRKDLEGYVKRRGSRQKNSSRGLKVVPPMLHTGCKFETLNLVAVDLKTLPKTERGNNYMILVVYYSPKYVAARPPGNKARGSSCKLPFGQRLAGLGAPGVHVIREWQGV